ncbi:amino acid adenylation domain-containing protein [Actinophytocola sp.]|uniref:amino acid adenylation domain-containing protein n=1 Tax=Actinophytocola sp. TaxID=1872138 RepID=UPI003D6B610B
MTDELRLLAAQSEVWTAHEIDPENPQFNCAGYLDLRGPFRPDLFARAIETVDDECEALRLRPDTGYGDGSSGVSARLADPGLIRLETIDLAATESAEAAALAWMEDDVATPLRLGTDKLVRLALFRLTPDRHLFYLRYHHLVMDGYGQVLYWRRLARVYSALAEERQPPRRPFGGLGDLADEARAYAVSAEQSVDRAYWWNRMVDAPEKLDLGGAPDQAGGVLRAGPQTGVPMRILHSAAAARDTHWSVLVIAALAAYLHRLTGRDDLVIGFPVRSRTTRLALTTPAMVSNELPLRLSVPDHTTLAALVTQTGAAIRDLLGHQRFRGEELYRSLRAARPDSDLPTVVANVIQFDESLRFGDSIGAIRQLSVGPVRGLSFDFYGGVSESTLGLDVSAVASAFGRSDVNRHHNRFAAFLETFLAARDGTLVNALELLESRERTLLETNFNDTARDYDLSDTLPELVAAQAARTPDSVAISAADGTLTYAEFLDRADRLASHLAGLGVRPGDIVGVRDVRSPELVVSLLAILRAGAAYLPLDPELPRARLRFQIEDARVHVVLTRSTLPALDAPVVVPVDTVLPDLPAAHAPDVATGPDDAAYVIYTSGSTGQPKGVVVPHRGICNRLAWMRDDYGVDASDRVLQKTSFGFDVSVWEFFLPLITGGVLRMLDPGAQRDPDLVARAVADDGITVLHFVPSMLDLFLQEHGAHDLGTLRHVFCSGEALRSSTVEKFFARFPVGVRLHNLYGPTEAAVDVTAWECRPGTDPRTVPIGRPVANTQIHILDGGGRRVPIGVPGELYIGGVQVASGYLHRSELTEQKFVPNPFGAGRLYRTGDVARWRDDGVLEFLGRADHQIKVRGYRIEPGEIEAALLTHPAVRQAVVVADDDEGARRILAHVVRTGELDRDELRRHLAEQLPAYMIPAVLLPLDAIPLLPNGKIDHGALRELRLARSEADDSSTTPPETPREHQLAEVWQDVLDVRAVDVRDSFFALGGDSMLAIKVRTELGRRHRLSFTVAELFAGPTIRELAGRLVPVPADPVRSEPFGLLDAADLALLPDGLDDAYPLGSMQAGMLYASSHQEDSSVYRVVTSVAVPASLDIDDLRAACRETVARHPQLRCSIELARYSEPLQLVHSHVDVPLEVLDDLGELDADARADAVAQFVERAKGTVFDVAEPPLLRFAVHPCGADGFQFTAIEHHVLLDGWSDVLLLEEIIDRYHAVRTGTSRPTEPVRSVYRDFVAAERATLADPAARDYWVETLRDAPVTTLVPHHDGPRFDTSRVRRFELDLAPDLALTLRAVSKEHDLPLKSLLVVSHVLALATVSGLDEVVTGVVANARLEEPGGDEVVGVFLNTLPLRVDVTGGTPLELARRVLAWEQRSAPHRRYPYGQIQRDLGESSQIGTVRSYVNFMDFHRERYRTGRAALDATLSVADTNFPMAVDFLVEPGTGALRGWLDCDVAVLPEELCHRLAGYHRRALETIAAHPELAVSSIDLLSSEEHQALASWHGPATDYDRTATVHGMFEAQTARTPDAPAVTHHENSVSYAELNAAANRIAHRLVQVGVRPGDLVGVSVRRSVRLVAALVGVLKAGAAYVPMDPTFPLPRLRTIAADADIKCLVRESGTLDLDGPVAVDLDHEMRVLDDLPATVAPVRGSGEDRAYVMYTSGSTGAPKGAVVTHRNVVNFFTGMDDRVGCGADDVVLAVTSISFDISVLELIWPLTRGAHVVVAGEQIAHNLVRPDSTGEVDHPLGFSLFFFAAAAGEHGAQEAYRLVLDAARFADTHGFRAIWTPERHFHEFGGLYPNPSVMSAALATATDRIALRSGSVVGPLHDPVRLAEEWSLVDNLSGGRVGLAFASGWNSNDFVFFPDHFAERKKVMVEHLEQFRALWRGDPVERTGGSGEQVRVRIFPRPRQAEPPLWLTSVGTVATFQQAGRHGVNVLTHLLGQPPDALAEKITAYREARREAGHEGPGQVTLMVHTFMSGDPQQARREARAPFRDYLRSSTELWRTMFATTGQEFPEQDAESYVDAVIEQAIDRYFETSGLFGSPETCAPLLRQLADAGVDEVACLIDFGVSTDAALESLTWVDRLRRNHEDEVAEQSHTLRDLCLRHRVTLMQGTPSLCSAIAAEPMALDALRATRALLVGGEAFPAGLAHKLVDALPGVRVLNMYGPTETTIWSTVHELSPADEHSAVPIGTPIANTPVRVVDAHGRDVPAGVAGELWIGGDGVASGYLDRPGLTADRFVTTRDGRYYRTGDRVRRGTSGVLEFLGRVDRQVKIHGHRVEPDEVENVLSRHPDVDAVAVVPVDGVTGTELVAYVTPSEMSADDGVEESHIRRWGEVWQETYGTADEAVDDDFVGWVSSYTGNPIPADEMREWLAHTVERVCAHSPRAVVDVGVGVGLVLRGLVDSTTEYHGVDISAAALSAAARCLGARPLPEHVHLVRSGPEYLAQLPTNGLDAVLLNSVAQYFPSTQYLHRVLTEATRVVRPGGVVHVGDVRHLELLTEFHTSVALRRAPVLQPVEQVRTTIARHVRDEPELCLSPTFFRQFAGDSADTGDVHVDVKRGWADNELTAFRYDVTLHVGSATAAPPVARVDWAGLDDLSSVLKETNESLLVTGVPNRRLVRHAAAARLLTGLPAESTVWDVERSLWNTDDRDAVHPEELVDAASQAGRTVRLAVPANGSPLTVDAYFEGTEAGA